ncbi:MAG: DUF4861 family protein [Algibacter sp.]|uniref:DUF4861 family protein n=1 Tax=Algibacter sp. TaxID=1872428 RepID=UPI00329A210E
MKNILFCALLTGAFFTQSCKQEASGHILTVKNTLDVSRSNETVEIKKSDLTLKEGESFEKLAVQDATTKAILVSQFVDEDQDGNADVLLFQPELAAKSEKQFKLVSSQGTKGQEVTAYCYSRFVPERTDDYAWENNKVAFRTYGPVAQKMVEDGTKGGTLSSGIDAWLKKVDYPIINKWYAKNHKSPGAYHLPSPEGLDNFHVGVSRGVGGTAVKIDTTYYVSKNFTDWKVITTGPIRTSFILDYADWDANGKTISEKKYISLDYGSNLTKYEIEVAGTNSISSGLTLHENDGVPTENTEAGWVSYWEPHGDSELGTAIVVPNGNMISSEYFVTGLTDQSNLYAQIKVNQGKVVFYSGYGWKEANEFTTKESWENYVKDFTLKINNPLEISLN